MKLQSNSIRNLLNSLTSNEIKNLTTEVKETIDEGFRKEIKKILPNAKILLVDGEFFSWYGSRLLQAPAYFLDLIKKNNCITKRESQY